MAQKPWSDYPPAVRATMLVASLVELLVTATAFRDLIRRPARNVRGPKLLWGLGLLVQPVGSPLYMLVGRRRSP